MNTIDVALICKALSDSNRLQIIELLSDGEKCGCKLLEKFNITQPTLSH
ncbi:MAG: metalloregulator ArsR/SmtB family transcription factor, partial [Lachnospiraceae bacterium]|nr:metalloregulator ArsR/SmtB family transcription factor [Lachnospiraceae bacterium]